MNKEEFIERRGELAYERYLELNHQWNMANSDKIDKHSHDQFRKGGSRYEKQLKYQQTGLRGERHKIRIKHAKRWRRYKKITAPESQCHHEWVSGTSRYRGVALVEKNAHQHGIIDVIEILEGKITLLVEGKLD